MTTDDQNSILRWVENQADSMRQLVEKVCNVNSYTENTSGIDSVRSIFRRQFEVIADTIDEPKLPDHEIVDPSGNVVKQPIASALQVIKRCQANKRIFLCIHLDTVYPPESPFQKCTEIETGILNGPGVIDAKGGAVILLFALKAFERYALAHQLGWEVILNTDEEIGSPSSQNLIKTRGQKCRLGLLFEPALPDGTLVDQRKGSGNYSIIVRGKSVHSGRDFHNGRNAIVKAAEIASRLHELNSVYEEVTINVARIDGGGPLNVVPDLAIVRVNLRVGELDQQTWCETTIKEIVAEFNSIEGFSCELHGAFFSPPKILDDRSLLLKQNIERAANSMNLNVAWRSTGGVSDGNKLSSVNLPNIDTLGARGDHMHNPNEFLILDSLVERVKLTTLLLMRYASGEYSLD
jgi:glutamate carboxypeptidase